MGDPARRKVAGSETGGQPAPLALPLREIGHLTASFRAELARRHDKRAGEAMASALAALDALPRVEPDPVYVATLENPSAIHPEPWKRDKAEDSIAVRVLEPMNRPGAMEPGYEPAPTVKRLRRRWAPYRDKKGRARRRLEVTAVDVPSHKAHATSAAWHVARSGGQVHRMRHVGACGTGIVRVSCEACGTVHEKPLSCAVVRLCPGCNRKRSAKMRSRFATSVDVVLQNAERVGMLRRRRPGGALGQHFITLTAPHVHAEAPSETVRAVGGAWGWVLVEHRAAFGKARYLERRKATTKRRCAVVLGAWRAFSRRLQAWLRQPWPDREPAEGAPIAACWHRAFEWTRGEHDDLGHPHLHLWALSPWIPEHDDHRVVSITGARTTPCAGPRRLRGAWGWAETMRRERCAHCVPPEAIEMTKHPPKAPKGAWGFVRRMLGAPKKMRVAAEPAPAGAWGWAKTMRRERTLDAYYAAPRVERWTEPHIVRRAGMRTWWADALAEQGAPIDERLVIVSVRAAEVKPSSFMREVQKPNGITYRERVLRRLEMRDSAGRLVNYFEAWCVAFTDAAPEVIAGVYEALEGVRLSQSSKVRLQRRSGEVVTRGLLQIADCLYDASCRDCTDADTQAGKLLTFGERRVEVLTATRVAGARIGPPLPPATAPPAPTMASETLEGLVRRLQREAWAEAHGAATLARTAEVCDLIRTEGPSLLPAYRRTRLRPPEARGLRAKMARQRRGRP